jgi:hypothetical protein
MAKAKMVYETENFRFEWHGGAYIELFFTGSTSALDVVNVWDYEKDEPRIERTLTAFEEFIEGYIKDAENNLSELAEW